MDKYSSGDMTSKSWTATSTFQWPPSRRRLVRHTDPIVSDGGRKTSKRRSEESLERASKKSRTAHRPSDGCCQTFSGPLIIVIDTSSTSAVTGPADISGLSKEDSLASVLLFGAPFMMIIPSD